jgi:uncharacterized glyoxalase superfamily protein PhnB
MPANWGVIPSIRANDLSKMLHFYTGTLGFEVTRGTVDEGNVALTFGDARFMLESGTADFYGPGYNRAIRQRLLDRHPSAIALYIGADDLDGLYTRITDAGIEAIDPLADRPWGQAEFTIADPEGNWLCFWQVRTAQ